MVCTSPANVATRAAEIVAAADAAGPQFLGIAPQSISLSPADATNFLSDDTSHTVTATLLDGNGDPLSGYVIDIAVISGPATGFTTSGPSAVLSATYSNATSGTDTIRATTTFTVPTGQKVKQAGKQDIVLAGNPVSGTVTGTATKDNITYRIDLKANSDLLEELATDSEMTIQLIVGSDAFQQTAVWDKLRNGWKVNLQ